MIHSAAGHDIVISMRKAYCHFSDDFLRRKDQFEHKARSGRVSLEVIRRLLGMFPELFECGDDRET